MLVISRKIGESFMIGDEIEATVIDITGEKVVLGIAAPRSLIITRCEIDPAIREAMKKSGAINAKGYARQYNSKALPDSEGAK